MYARRGISCWPRGWMEPGAVTPGIAGFYGNIDNLRSRWKSRGTVKQSLWSVVAAASQESFIVRRVAYPGASLP